MKHIYPGPIDRLVWMQQEAGGANTHLSTTLILDLPMCLHHMWDDLQQQRTRPIAGVASQGNNQQ